jgi:ElaA protein
MKQPVEWKLCAFNALSVVELHDVLQLRSEVFVVEQHCIFQDVDGSDPLALHLLGHQDGQLQAYARCFPAGVKYPEASIGRVVTRPAARGTGLGHALIKQAVASVVALWRAPAIRIGAQAQLIRFYGAHGFVDTGISYVEDGIDHVEMLWQA